MMTRSHSVVPDAGPIIHLDELGRLSLLADFEEVRVVPAVLEEVARHRPRCLDALGSRCRVALPEPRMTEFIEPLCRALSLDAGEREALAIARSDPEALFITDDAAARIAALQIGLTAHGTLASRQRRRPHVLGRSVHRFMLPVRSGEPRTQNQAEAVVFPVPCWRPMAILGNSEAIVSEW